ncbi:MAG: hypothetical protein AAGK10_17015 [Cyanobacteria bacterium J06555_3]
MRSLWKKTKIKDSKTISSKMKTNKVSDRQSESRQATDNPLADVAGKFSGEFWLETQLEIERFRKEDREETNVEDKTR